MGLFTNQFATVVEWEEWREDMIFWKWTNREIKKGSKLIIKPGQDAIFLYNGKVEGIFKDDGSFSYKNAYLTWASAIFIDNKDSSSLFNTKDEKLNDNIFIINSYCDNDLTVLKNQILEYIRYKTNAIIPNFVDLNCYKQTDDWSCGYRAICSIHDLIENRWFMNPFNIQTTIRKTLNKKMTQILEFKSPQNENNKAIIIED